ADLLFVGWDQVALRTDDVRQRERLIPWQHLHGDRAIRGDLGVDEFFEPGLEVGGHLGQVEVHPRLARLHVAAGHQRTEVAEYDATQHVQAGVRTHEEAPALILDGAGDLDPNRRQRVARLRDQIEVVALARARDPGLHAIPQQHAVIRRLAATARIEGR